MLMMETATENLPVGVVGSPLLSSFSRLGSWGSESIGETVETYPPIHYKEPSRHHRVLYSSLSMPDLNKEPPLFEIYVRQKSENGIGTELRSSDVTINAVDFHSSSNNYNNNSDQSIDMTSYFKSSTSSCPTGEEEEGGDEDGPHLLRWGSSILTEEGDRTTSINWEEEGEDDTIGSVIIPPPTNEITPVIRRKQILPSKAAQANNNNNNNNKPSTNRKSKESPRSIHSFFDPIFNLLSRKKFPPPREPPELSDLHVPGAVSCSYDLSDTAETELNSPKFLSSPKCL
jgi:hypothetical protein